MCHKKYFLEKVSNSASLCQMAPKAPNYRLNNLKIVSNIAKK